MSRVVSLLLLLLLCVSGRLAAQEYVLQHNPFQVPSFAKEQDKPNRSVAVSTVKKTTSTKGWQAKLVATVVAGQHSMANVDGTILSIGEATNDGYQLVAVAAKSATFIRSGRRHQLTIKTQKRQTP